MYLGIWIMIIKKNLSINIVIIYNNIIDKKKKFVNHD